MAYTSDAPARTVEELERALREAHLREAATGEILQIISASPMNTQPVFEAIVNSGQRLIPDSDFSIALVDGEQIRLVAFASSNPTLATVWRTRFPHALSRDYFHGRAILDREIVDVADVLEASEAQAPGKQNLIGSGYRANTLVPLVRGDKAIGAIAVPRLRPGALSERQVALLRTFADQAVIAIENARLFEEVQVRTRELQEALAHQTATTEVLNVISRSPTQVSPVFEAIVRSAADLCGAAFCNMQLYDGGKLDVVATHNFAPDVEDVFRRSYPMAPNRAWLASRAILDRAVVHVPDVRLDPEYPQEMARAGNWRAILSVPMLRDGAPVGVISVSQPHPTPFSQRQIELLKTFADQAVIAMENARLFEEIAQKSRELEIASQHKSQFVANMSHELRTPLAAILGYAELMQEGFYEPPGPKSMDALTRIRTNGNHLLSLINTVLDIAKIESGQFSLSLGEYAVENIVETVRAATESLADTKKLVLVTDVAKPLAVAFGDEQRLTQVLLNLVGNAIKFTDRGEVRVTASADKDHFTVSVADTGPGIPGDQLTRVFEQFHQVDGSHTKAKGGTGLGLAISKQIVEMHGGRIWVESTLGKGATFQIRLPIRAEARKATA